MMDIWYVYIFTTVANTLFGLAVSAKEWKIYLTQIDHIYCRIGHALLSDKPMYALVGTVVSEATATDNSPEMYGRGVDLPIEAV